MAKVNYESRTCGRCGGGGRYSYCQMHGDTCFKCGGSGKVATKRGAEARKAMAAKRMELTGVLAADITPGTRVRFNGYTGWSTVTEVKQSGSYCEAGGKRTYYINLHTATICHSVFPDTKLATLQADKWPLLVEFARALKGAEVVE